MIPRDFPARPRPPLRDGAALRTLDHRCLREGNRNLPRDQMPYSTAGCASIPRNSMKYEKEGTLNPRRFSAPFSHRRTIHLVANSLRRSDVHLSFDSVRFLSCRFPSTKKDSSFLSWHSGVLDRPIRPRRAVPATKSIPSQGPGFGAWRCRVWTGSGSAVCTKTSLVRQGFP